ncbi:MAG: heavy metal translocating P-type ATPase [Chloroflexota bacterium]|nr:heavy metal translocating P-type ATPase [Chloroflexota bacterium]
MRSKQITLPVTGMTCAICVKNVERSLKRADGVADVSVNLATEKATVAYDADRLQTGALIQRLEAAGYGVAAAVIDLPITGMTCAMCQKNVSRALSKTDGVISADVNLASEKATVSYLPGAARRRDLVEAVERAGYGVIDASQSHAAEDHEAAARQAEIDRQTRLVKIGAVFTIPLTILSMTRHFIHQAPFIMDSFPWLRHDLWLFIFGALATPVLLILGRQYLRGAIKSLRNRSANMDLLVAMGAIAAYVYGIIVLLGILFDFSDVVGKSDYFESAAVILTLVTLGKLLEARAKGRTSAAIKKLIGLRPKTATLLSDGKEKSIPIDEVAPGDLLLIKPGERIPVDAIVTEGRSSVDESMLSGESMPANKKTGDELIAGTVNQRGRLIAEAQRVGKDTVLGQIIRLVEAAQGSKAPIQAIADRVSAYFVPLVIALAIITLVGWLTIGNGGGADLPTAILNMIAVLVIACPCALGLATPTAIMVGTGRGAESGILFRNSEALERTKALGVILLDKTGTITAGQPSVTDVIARPGSDAESVLRFAASAEAGSEHPLAAAALAKAEAEAIDPLPLDSFEALPGRGLRAAIAGRTVLVGNAKLMRENSVNTSALDEDISRLTRGARTVALVAVDGEMIGALGIGDPLKPSSRGAIAALNARGLEVAMITGDNEGTAQAIAQEVGITRVYADVLPADKAAVVKQLQDQGEVVGMVGDGINDAPALASADVGFAIGTGTDIAIEAGDVTLVSGDLTAVVAALDLSRRTMRAIYQNLFWAFIYNIVLIPVAMLGGLLPMFAAAAMAFSSVFVVTNSLRLRGKSIA